MYRRAADLGARPQIKYFSKLFRSRPWWNLSPDWSRKFLTSTTLEGGFDQTNDNYTIAAFDTVQGKLGIVYCTTLQTVTIDLSKMSGPANVCWYDPTTGEFTNIPESPFPNRNQQQFTTPPAPHNETDTENNPESSNDWVLVVESH